MESDAEALTQGRTCKPRDERKVCQIDTSTHQCNPSHIRAVARPLCSVMPCSRCSTLKAVSSCEVVFKSFVHRMKVAGQHGAALQTKAGIAPGLVPTSSCGRLSGN
eukprot:4654340-Pleurochrysis_carterae.AAC.2